MIDALVKASTRRNGKQLMSPERAAAMLAAGIDQHGFSLEASVIGGSYAPHQASVPVGEALCVHCDAPLLSQAADLPPAPTLPTPGSHQ